MIDSIIWSNSSRAMGGIDELFTPRLGVADLAVDAMEVADLVDIEVHAQREAAGPATEHGIYVAVLLKAAGVGLNKAETAGGA